MVFQLDERLIFPDPYLGEPDGLIAVGGDLSVNRLLLAYQHGIFPWYSFRGNDEPLWFCPLERFVIFPDEIHISHSMRTLLKKDRYQMTINKAFKDVIHQCGVVNGRINEQGAWLGEHIEEAYNQLYDSQYAASVEVWEDDRLVGGLYGVTIGKCFMGESMFSLVPNGSKLALIFLAKLMQHLDGKMIDCQFETPHLRSMGGRYISYEEYMAYLQGDK